MAKTVESVLSVIDVITQAKNNISDQATLQGFEMINTQFINSLEKIGVKKIESVGLQFNPNLHNAVQAASDEGLEDGVVLEEYQQGFIYNEKVIRHSVVKVNKLS